jgi:hypothetical protein
MVPLRIIRGDSTPLYAGLTVNESPVIPDLMKEWNRAVLQPDRAGMTEILRPPG